MIKSCAVILTMALTFTCLPTCVAAEAYAESNYSEIVAIREDVSREDALNDINFDMTVSNDEVMLLSTDVYWDVKGEYDYAIINSVPGAYPVGYSTHMSGDTVLNTYHYTRTYLGAVFKSGDSGRVWGTGTVKARGTFCDDETWISSVHYVRDGTETD